MSLTFKERMALRAAGGSAPLAVESAETLPAVTPLAPEPKPVRRFGAPKDVPVTPDPEPTPEAATKPASRFGGFKATVEALEPEPTAAEVEVPPEEADASPLPKVIQAFNALGSGQQVASNGQTEGELLSGKEAPAAVALIQQKIHELSSLGEVDLRYEMVKLQGMLTENPSACLYMLDEDLGLAVRALRRMTNNRVAIDMASARPSAKAKAANKPLTAAEMASAVDDL